MAVQQTGRRKRRRKGAVRKRTQLKTKIEGRGGHGPNAAKKSGQFMDQKKDDKKFKGVRREKAA